MPVYIENEGERIPQKQSGYMVTTMEPKGACDMSTISLQMADSKTAYFQGNTYSYKDMIKAIPGSRWEKKAKRWEIPMEATADALRIFPSLIVSDEVKAAFESIRERQQAAIAVKKNPSEAKTAIKGLKGALRSYQGQGVSFLNTLQDGEGDILAFDMGTGKSLTGLAFFQDLMNQGKADHLLVVCPSPLKYATWAKEVEKWTDLEYIVVDGDKREEVEWEDGTKQKLTGQKLREVQYQQHLFGTHVIIMNYELFLRDFDIIPNVNHRWVVVLDEAHRIKNPKAQTTKNLIKKLRPAGRKVLATGTPLENNVQELWSLVDFCRPNLLGNYYKFLARYIEVDYFGNPVAPKPQMMGELRAKLDPIMFRVTKAEALPELPPLTIQEYWVDMTKEQENLYKAVKDGILQNAETGEFSYLEVIVQITRMQQLLDSPALLRELMGDPNLPIESGKLNELRNVINDIDPNRNKFILFSQYKEMTDILYKWMIDNNVLPKEQIGYVKGGIKATETERIRKEFQEGNMQCVIMTTAGNYGLDLSAGKYVICFDQLFNPQKMEQIFSRAHRGGNATGVTAINFVTRNSYEERKLKVLEAKREVFKAMVDADDETFAKLFTKEELLNML
jgi:SNF2 family DNA or RNA helicase